MFVMQCKKILNLSVKNLISFKGRSSRSEFIIKILCLMLLGSIINDVYGINKIYKINWLIVFLVGIYTLILLMYCVQIIPLIHRRLHDLNLSGWWQLMMIIPCGQLMMIGFIFFKGTEGRNKYGDPPEY